LETSYYGEQIFIKFFPTINISNHFEVAAFEYYLKKIDFKIENLQQHKQKEINEKEQFFKDTMHKLLCLADSKYETHGFDRLPSEVKKKISLNDKFDDVAKNLDQELKDYICKTQRKLRALKHKIK
jgi:hypothetical protein